jgi:hypothetical protein
MLQISDEVILDLEVALDRSAPPRASIHIFDHGARGVVLDAPVAAPEAQTRDAVEAPAVGHVLARIVELLARDEVDGGRGREGTRRIDRHLRAHHADQQPRDSPP